MLAFTKARATRRETLRLMHISHIMPYMSAKAISALGIIEKRADASGDCGRYLSVNRHYHSQAPTEITGCNPYPRQLFESAQGFGGGV